ncbi:MAG: ATP-binding protein [Bacteroidia bacterium]
MTTTTTISELTAFEVFKDIPEEQLTWFLSKSEERIFQDGELLFGPDEPMLHTHVIMTGNVKVLLSTNNQQREIYLLTPGEITGTLPYSRATTSRASGIAKGETRVISFHKENYHELICNNHELTTRFVHEMTTRVREFTQLQTQNEKMMALGKLSAGLAHELNNPASAIVRSSTSLKEHLQLMPDSFKKITSIDMTDEQVDLINDRMLSRINDSDRASIKLSMMERANREDDLVDWMDDHQVEDAMEMAENFVEFGFDQVDFDFFIETIPEAHLGPVLGWINGNLVTEKMVSDIQEASKRIASLVSSVKNFTHMDRAGDKQKSNLHDGIRNTLTMLNHKMKKSNVKLIENFDPELPEANIMVSELNQVWTNIIDNAIDVLETVEDPTLEITTSSDGSFIRVHIIDNGPGIPDEIKNRIFEPFFTTKSIGKGTGLGLDVVTRIVSQHNGKISLESKPGKTDFEVCIPIN